MTNTTTTTSATRLLRLPEVMRRTSLARASIYKLARENKFPRPRKVTERTAAWREDEVQQWIDARPVSDMPSPNPAVQNPQRPRRALKATT